MNSLRTILVGLIVGGAFGSKAAAYLSSLGTGEVTNWSSIELGFLLGGGFGLAFSFAVLFVRGGLFERKQADVNPQLSIHSV